MAAEERAIILSTVAARPYPGETASGDAWLIDHHSGCYRLALIDGLGHGPDAAAAAVAGIESLTTEPGLDLVTALQHCHLAMRGTRGGAVALVQIDPATSRLTFAGVGNVEGRLYQERRDRRLMSARGIVGATMPTVRPETVSLATDWTLVLHSDGVSSRFVLGDLLASLTPSGDPQPIADAILASWGRMTDDATALVARSGTTWIGQDDDGQDR